MKRHDSEPPLFDLPDDAVRLVRNASAGTLFFYFLGAVPFCLGLLYFWADLSQGREAERHLAPASFALALLYAWMKGCQSIYAVTLRREMEQAASSRWTARAVAALFVRQAVVQPSRLIVLPLAALALLPFGWVHAFYENLTVLGDRGSIAALCRDAWAQARLWPRQNHVLIWLLSPFPLLGVLAAVLGCVYLGAVLWPHQEFMHTAAFLFGAAALAVSLLTSPLGVLVWVNIAALFMALPLLLRMIFGVETVFTLSGMHVLNTTFLLATTGVAFLVLDPFLKAAHVLRCFRGEARQTGRDLSVALRTLGRPSALLLPLLMAGAAFCPLPARAATPAPAPVGSPAAVAPTELGTSIERVLARPEYSWRSPGEARAGGRVDFMTAFFRSVRQWLHRHFGGEWRDLKKWGEKLGDWLRRFFESHEDTSATAPRHGGFTRRVVYAAGGISVSLLLWLLLRRRLARRAALAAPVETGTPVPPDLADESVLPTDLPVDAWAELARELQARGDFRLALRALYFSMLARLAERDVIRIGRSKSNRDYLQEVVRRSGPMPAMAALFRENIGLFERSWYGSHPAGPEGLSAFERNNAALVQES